MKTFSQFKTLEKKGKLGKWQMLSGKEHLRPFTHIGHEHQ